MLAAAMVLSLAACALAVPMVAYYDRARLAADADVDAVPPGYDCRASRTSVVCRWDSDVHGDAPVDALGATGAVAVDGDTWAAGLPQDDADAQDVPDSSGRWPLRRRRRAAVTPEATPLSWGQSRVDQRDLPLDNQYNPDRTGNGATVWVVSSGVDESIGQLAGRASNPFFATTPNTDCNGAGTELGVVAGGSSYGIAWSPFVRGVKVLDCGGGGSSSQLVEGLTYIRDNPASRNVVLIGVTYLGRNEAVEEVVEALIADDMTVVAGAGDQATSACNFFPGSQAGVISVAASRRNDARYALSNYGSCVDMFAPGQDVTTQTLGGTVVNRTGTDIAAAHVAAAAAMRLQGSPNNDGAQVLSNLLGRATLDHISDAKGTPNALLFVLQDSNPPQTTTTGSSSTSSSTATALLVPAIAWLSLCVIL